ncbi:hypothetical protein CALCODRAFT_495691 [Calocera cornea HHB12733]|uniref:Uncharacterized protein n=1 Tax=Calocera cornea HHB12733 TaxID=1353952 RepID=A0A165GBF9_9BASI|nr:hypothetical protein CALCODRAFT_495691 [Calocera cornea HHB12733]
MGSTEMDTLLSALTIAISELQESIDAQGFPPLRSDDLAPHPLDNGVPDPVSFYARRAIIGLCQQITALVQEPAERAQVHHLGFLISGCVAAATETQPSLAEVVLDAGPEGVSLREVADKTGLDFTKLRKAN